MNKYEPLREKKLSMKYSESKELSEKVRKFYVSDVKSAAEFYKRYRSYPLNSEGYLMLRKEHPELLKLYNKSNMPYNDWLFDYCFGDVTE